MLLAHLSDLHVTRPDALLASFADGAAALDAAVAQLVALDRPPDAVIVTGDLVDDGTVAEYRRLAEGLAPLERPTYLLVGNHDDRSALASVLGDRHGYLPEPDAPHAGWVVDDHPLRLVAFDTVLDGRHDGEVVEERLVWLDEVLTAATGRPTVVAMHHPPVPTGMWWMDYGGLRGRNRLRDVITRHPQVVRVIAGHVHRAFQASWGPTVVSTAPSLSYQSSLGLRGDSAPLITDQPTAIPLLWWDGEGILAGHADLRVPHRSLDLRDIIDPWEPYEVAARRGGPMLREGH